MPHNLIVSRNRSMIAFLRERYLGTEWEITDEPSRAIEVLSKEPFDRIFCDYWLDREPANGRDLSLWLGAHPDINPAVQFIATTDNAKKGQQMIAECGRVAYHIPGHVIEALGA